MLKIRGLKKRYGDHIQALRSVSLDLPTGVFGLLGPNGAGKTTLMKILATLLDADDGQIEMNGADWLADKDRSRRSLGYLPQEFGFYPTLTAEQTLDYFARLKGVAQARERKALVEALLERVNLLAVGRQRVGEFSGGMRQRLGIAQAIIGKPDLLIVDEPTAGLDPEERMRFHNLLVESAGEQAVVILSTHIVSDVSNLCGRMAIIRQGEILACGTPRQAVTELGGSVWEATLPRDQAQALRARFKTVSLQSADGQSRLRVICEGGPPGEAFRPVTPTLEDYYFHLVSRPAGGE